MNDMFLNIINMSISASWLILAVLFIRLILKKAPKWINVLLWGIVALRLICPFMIESEISLIPSAETIPTNIAMDTTPAIDSGINLINDAINPIISHSNTPLTGASANPLQITIGMYEYIWRLGMLALVLYAAISYWRLRRRLNTAVRHKDNIFQSENVTSPFVLGIIKPKIFLPFNLNTQDMSHVIAHEQAHIRRKDHLWKPIGFLLLAIYWFNPLIWLAYILLCRDIELACDEKVIKELGNEQRADYTQALVSCSVNHRTIAACPLVFGEVGVKERVKSIMHYQKPAFWLIVIAIIICIIVAACFLTNPKQDKFSLEIVIPAGSQKSIIYANEEISPLNNHIIVTSDKNLGDTEVFLKAVQTTNENDYDKHAYLTPDMPVQIPAEKGGWFKIGVNMQNNTNEDITVYVDVKNVEVRIADTFHVDLEQYRTDYIGNAPKVSQLTQHLPYPKDYQYSSVKLLTHAEPYELLVYLIGNKNVQKDDFANCAATAFDLIGNMDVISFWDAKSNELITTFNRTEFDKHKKFYLTIGAEDVTYIEISLPNSSGGCQNADGSTFKLGEQIYLEPLNGIDDLRGLQISAQNAAGEIVWFASIPDNDENKGFTHLTIDDWLITNISANED